MSVVFVGDYSEAEIKQKLDVQRWQPMVAADPKRKAVKIGSVSVKISVR